MGFPARRAAARRPPRRAAFARGPRQGAMSCRALLAAAHRRVCAAAEGDAAAVLADLQQCAALLTAQGAAGSAPQGAEAALRLTHMHCRKIGALVGAGGRLWRRVDEGDGGKRQ